jgi:signal transduction histidine kinase
MATVVDITKRTRAAASLSAALAERDELLRRFVQAQEDERLRLAHELHDQTGQILTALMLELKDIENISDRPDRNRLRAVRQHMEQMGKALHHVAYELRPASLDELGLASALANYAAEWSDQYGIECDFHCADPNLDDLPDGIRTTIYRVLQEGLTNIAKHAPTATSVGVVIDRPGSVLMLTIDNNGTGFDATKIFGSSGARSGLGLPGMRERLALVGGDFAIESSDEAGTTIFARIRLPTSGPVA